MFWGFILVTEFGCTLTNLLSESVWITADTCVRELSVVLTSEHENTRYYVPSSFCTVWQINAVQSVPRSGCRNYIYRHLVALSGRGILPSQAFYLHRTTQTEKPQTYICAPECDSNQWSLHSSNRKQYVLDCAAAVISRLLYLAYANVNFLRTTVEIVCDTTSVNLTSYYLTAPHRHLWANYLENVGASTSHNPTGLRGLLGDIFTFNLLPNGKCFSIHLERISRGISIRSSYSRWDGFKSRLADRLSRLRLLVVFLDPSIQILG
jgi:hypothetical protein